MNIGIILVQLEDKWKVVHYDFFSYFPFVFQQGVKCFREGMLKVTVNTNNGVVSKDENFKYKLLS